MELVKMILKKLQKTSSNKTKGVIENSQKRVTLPMCACFLCASTHHFRSPCHMQHDRTRIG